MGGGGRGRWRGSEEADQRKKKSRRRFAPLHAAAVGRPLICPC